jgi:hypothetical protein
VSDNGERLREAFHTHESLSPDPAAVYARVQELARKYRRRRRGAQAAGGAVLGAGLLAGAIQVPSLLAGRQPDTFTMVAPAAEPSASAVPSAAAPPTEKELQERWDAYFGAGYDYEDAVRLAKLWKSRDDIGTIKAEAGRRLLAGETLPIEPTPEEEPAEEPTDPAESAAVQKFFDAGYVWDDAVRLADLWKLADPYQAKVAGGEKLRDGQKLPFKPKPANLAAAKESARVAAFFEAGYDYQDAAKLADLWKLADAYQAKLEGGKRLLAGDSLPIEP